MVMRVGSKCAAVVSAGAMAVFVSGAWAVNTTGYVQLSEVKAFDDRVLAYPADGQEHQCTSSLEKNAFRLDPAKKHTVAALYLAYAQRGTVNLSYDCGTDGLPYINAVRVRP